MGYGATHMSLTERDHRLDTAKGILICLVVLGHLLETVTTPQNTWIRLLLVGIYTFHMPAFIFMAGITSKPQNLSRRIATLVIWLVGFQALYGVFLVALGREFNFFSLKPYWILWFLLAMIWWTGLTPLIIRLRWTAVAASVVLSVGSGLVPFVGYPLALSRTLVFCRSSQ